MILKMSKMQYWDLYHVCIFGFNDFLPKSQKQTEDEEGGGKGQNLINKAEKAYEIVFKPIRPSRKKSPIVKINPNRSGFFFVLGSNPQILC